MAITEWSARDQETPLWPPSAIRVQVVITRDQFADDRLVWVVSGGTTLLSVLQVHASDWARLKAQVGSAAEAFVNPRADDGNGGDGAPGPTNPPGPGGPRVAPPDVMRVVLAYTSQNDKQLENLDAEVASGTAHQ